MNTLKVDNTVYICNHWKTFPPKGAKGDIEGQRSRGEITDEQYSHLQIWKRECGLHAMSQDKCLTCPHRRTIKWRTTGPVLVDPKGLESPVIDMAAGEASQHYRPVGGGRLRPPTRNAPSRDLEVEDSDAELPE